MIGRELRAGWRNLAAATLGLSTGVPAYTAVSSLFFDAIRREFHWSSATTAGALIAMPITAAALPLIGWLLDRIGVRIVTGLSMLGLVAGFVWLAHLDGRPGDYYSAVILLNLLGCATGPVGYTRLVAGAFDKARGAALAISQFGIAAVAMLLPILLSGLITAEGWRSAYMALAAGALAGGLGAQVLMRAPARTSRFGADIGAPLATAISRPAFWILGLAILSVSGASLGLVSQLQPLLLDRGIDAATGGRLLSLLALSVMVSRLVVGRLLDLGTPGRWSALVILCAGAGALLLWSAGGAMPLLVAGILLFGMSVGAELDLMAFFCARLFGIRHYSQIYGALAIFFYAGIAVGGIGYGVLRDRAGSYDPALLGSALLMALSSWLFLRLDHTNEVEAAAG